MSSWFSSTQQQVVAPPPLGLAAGPSAPLRSLNVRNTGGITDESMRVVFQNCSRLAFVNIRYTLGRITDAAIPPGTAIGDHGATRQQAAALVIAAEGEDGESTPAAWHHEGLRVLDVSYTGQKVTDLWLLRLSAGPSASSLTTLNVAGAESGITDRGMVVVARRCVNLTWLDVRSTHGHVTDRTILAVAECCPALRVIVVSETGSAITDASMVALALSCKQLRSLDVSRTAGQISDKLLDALGCTASPWLHDIDARWTAGKMSKVAIEALVAKCPHVAVVAS